MVWRGKQPLPAAHLFHENQTPRSDSANLEPSEPIFCPEILEPRWQREAAAASEALREALLQDNTKQIGTLRGPSAA